MENYSRERRVFSFLILMWLCIQMHSNAQEDLPYKEIPIGVVLNNGSSFGKMVHRCITMAVSDFYTVNSHYKTRIVVHSRDTRGEALHALSAALDLLEKPKVQAIIGSESAADAKFLSVLGGEAKVPILSLSPNPSSNKNPYFLQITQDEPTQFKAIAAMTDLFKWKNIILICEDTDNGIKLVKFMTNDFKDKSITMSYTSQISTSASNELIQQELRKLSAMQIKNFIMHTSHTLASKILRNAKFQGMMDAGYKWIITIKTMNFLNFMDDEVIESMQGVVGFKSYIPQSLDLQKFNDSMIKLYDINAYFIWVYDSVSALAMAIERIQAKEEVLKSNIEDLETTGLTQRGTALLNQILRISFQGLGGVFQLTNGKITTEVLEIVNMIDKGEKRVGFWTMDTAFTKKLGNLTSFSDDGLGAIIWPGGIMNNPTHWRPPMSSKTLRIAVPARLGGLFQVNSSQTNSPVISGFCAEVFTTAFAALDGNLTCKFVAISNRNYNDLIYAVFHGDFDAAIGDISITANRSQYVDFTLPFTDLGLAKLSRNADTSMWIFMKPLSSDLWVVSTCFFILMGIVIWILERRVNEEFQGSTAQQIGTTFWFAFSTLVYAHRHRLQSNLSRFVVSVWMFVVLVLTSSYIATLSSLLTVEQIKLASIGYQYGSFTSGVIVRNMNFENNNLKPYKTAEEYIDALTHGSKNGGVDAIIDEVPYIKEFLVKYPSGYTMTILDATTNGFGFAFPKGSELAPEMSSQIARLRENGTLKTLEDRWLNQHTILSKDSAPVPKVLNFQELRGLFLISGISMAVALFIFMLYYVHDKMDYTSTMLAEGTVAFIMRFLVHNTANAVQR